MTVPRKITIVTVWQPEEGGLSRRSYKTVSGHRREKSRVSARGSCQNTCSHAGCGWGGRRSKRSPHWAELLAYRWLPSRWVVILLQCAFLVQSNRVVWRETWKPQRVELCLAVLLRTEVVLGRQHVTDFLRSLCSHNHSTQTPGGECAHETDVPKPTGCSTVRSQDGPAAVSVIRRISVTSFLDTRWFATWPLKVTFISTVMQLCEATK